MSPDFAANPETKIDEDVLRAHVYQLIARFLSAPPTAETLALGARLEGDATPLGKAVATLAHLCQRIDADQANDEYHDLFIGVGRGELLPYASYYLTGFLHEKPLSKLRNTMSDLGIEARDNVGEPEDHIASLCEIMAGLITGAHGAAVGLREQRAFYNAHIAPWADHFFKDLEAAKASVLYVPVGAVGRAFMEIEKNGFLMLGDDVPGQ